MRRTGARSICIPLRFAVIPFSATKRTEFTDECRADEGSAFLHHRKMQTPLQIKQLLDTDTQRRAQIEWTNAPDQIVSAQRTMFPN